MASGHKHIAGPLSIEVGRILVDAMTARSVTRSEVAHRSGISEAQLSRALRGLKVFTLEQLDAVCTAIEVSITDVIDEADRRTRAIRSEVAEGIAIPDNVVRLPQTGGGITAMDLIDDVGVVEYHGQAAHKGEHEVDRHPAAGEHPDD